jgi:uncharacterized alkaline shock family protein YloU
MRPFQTLFIIFYTIVFIILGTICLAISLDLITLQQIINLSDAHNIRLSISVAGIAFILIGLLITHFTFGGIQRERTIAFNAPDGQVVISLSAIENFIKRLAVQMTEIKDMRSSIVASKKGIHISARVSLWSDTNIPDITEKIQSIIKNRIQDMLGIEEPIITKVHIVKIINREESRLKKNKGNAESIQPPFRDF